MVGGSTDHCPSGEDQEGELNHKATAEGGGEGGNDGLKDGGGQDEARAGPVGLGGGGVKGGGDGLAKS